MNYDSNLMMRLARWCAWLLCVALLLAWSAVSHAAINICTETDDAIANGPYTDGDGTEDITAAINECIAGISSTNRTTKLKYEDPYIPDGVYLISSKLTFPNRAGMSLRGAGAIGETESYIAEDTAGGRGYRTVLKWDGAEDGTMIEVQGKYVHLKDLCFNGRTAAAATASTGIHVVKGTSLATGHGVWERLSFWNFNDYGVRFGSAVGTNNCEEIDFYNCDFYDCGVAGVYAQNQFAFGLRFNGCRVVQGCPIFFWGAGGGKSVFNDCSVLTPNVTFLRTTQVTGGFGLNSSNYTINRIIIDNQASPGFKLIDGDSYNLDVTVNDGVQSILEDGEYVYTGEYVSVKGRSVVRFNGHRSNFNDMSGAYQEDYGTPVFIFNGCGGYAVDPRRQITGDYSVRQYACYNAVTGAMYDDYPPRTVSTQSVSTSGAAIAEVTGGYGEQVYGQPQLIVIDMQPILTKYTKTIEDVTEANVTLKFRQGISDTLADYDRNSTDDSEVTYAMEDVTVADGSTESHLIVRATVPYGDFGGSNIRASKTYYIGCGLTITGLSGSVEPDSTTNGTVKYVTQRVD